MFCFYFGATTAPFASWVDLYVGLFVLIGIIICGPISGAHMNPSVTLCNFLRKDDRFKVGMLPVYFLAQFLGVILAIVVSVELNDFNVEPFFP